MSKKKKKKLSEEKQDFWFSDIAIWKCTKCSVLWSVASHGKKCPLCGKVKTVEEVK